MDGSPTHALGWRGSLGRAPWLAGESPAAEHLCCMTGPRTTVQDLRHLFPGPILASAIMQVQPCSYIGLNATSRSLPKCSWHRCCLLQEASTLSQLPAITVVEQKQVHRLHICLHNSQNTFSKTQYPSDKGSKYEAILQ